MLGLEGQLAPVQARHDLFQDALVALKAGPQLSDDLERLGVRVELLPHQERVKYVAEDRLNIRNHNMPIDVAMIRDPEERPSEQTTDDGEKDLLRAGDLNDEIKPAI